MSGPNASTFCTAIIYFISTYIFPTPKQLLTSCLVNTFMTLFLIAAIFFLNRHLQPVIYPQPLKQEAAFAYLGLTLLVIDSLLDLSDEPWNAEPTRPVVIFKEVLVRDTILYSNLAVSWIGLWTGRSSQRYTLYRLLVRELWRDAEFEGSFDDGYWIL